MAVAIAPPASVDAVDDAWLGAALDLDGVRRGAAVPIGTGHMADTFRLDLEGAPWPAVVVKIAAADEASRATAARHRSYEVEVGFYRDVAGGIEARIPACHWAGWDAESGRYAVLLECVDGADAGDQLVGCTIAEADGALAELALLHAPRWGDEALASLSWVGRHGPDYQAATVTRTRESLPVFLERYAGALGDGAVSVFEEFGTLVERYDRRGQHGPRTIGHGDFRTDNLLFGQNRVCLVDWQTAFLGYGLVDVSYFLGSSLTVEDRRDREEDLVRGYWARLTAAGVPLSWDDCWLGYRRHAFEGIGMAIVAGPNVKRNDRGDELFVSWAERAAQQALDLRSADLLD